MFLKDPMSSAVHTPAWAGKAIASDPPLHPTRARTLRRYVPQAFIMRRRACRFASSVRDRAAVRGGVDVADLERRLDANAERFFGIVPPPGFDPGARG